MACLFSQQGRELRIPVEWFFLCNHTAGLVERRHRDGERKVEPQPFGLWCSTDQCFFQRGSCLHFAFHLPSEGWLKLIKVQLCWPHPNMFLSHLVRCESLLGI